MSGAKNLLRVTPTVVLFLLLNSECIRRKLSFKILVMYVCKTRELLHTHGKQVLCHAYIQNSNTSRHGIYPDTFCDNDQIADAELSIHNAPTYRLAPTLSVPALTVTFITLFQQQTNTTSSHDTLFHGKSLLVIATTNLTLVPLNEKTVVTIN